MNTKEKKEKQQYDWKCAWCDEDDSMPIKDFLKLQITGSNGMVELPCSHRICNKRSYHILTEPEQKVRNFTLPKYTKEVLLA